MAIKLYDDVLNCDRTFNMVNYDEPKFKSLGLEPLYIRLTPLYITPTNKLFYSSGDHYECDLTMDILDLLQLLSSGVSKTSNTYTISDYIKMKYYEVMDYIKFNDPNELSGNDVRKYINYNANIFCDGRLPLKTKGVYNIDTMNYINSIIDTKQELYKKILEIGLEQDDKIIEKLLEIFNINISKTNLLMKSSSYFFSLFDDMMVQLFGFDAIKTVKDNKDMSTATIITSRHNINREYFNYLIMNANIRKVHKIIYDKDDKQFRILSNNELADEFHEDSLADEIRYIKTYIPYGDRSKYLL